MPALRLCNNRQLIGWGKADPLIDWADISADWLGADKSDDRLGKEFKDKGSVLSFLGFTNCWGIRFGTSVLCVVHVYK